MSERTKSLVVFSGKCVTGTLALFIISRLIQYEDISWSLISVMLVLTPDGKDAVPLAVTRIKANLVGAAVGLLCLLISPANMWILSLALTLTLSCCYLFRLDAGIRSSLAATVIVMLHYGGKHVWDTAIERVIAVLAGCVLGLIITFIFHANIKPGSKPTASDQQEAQEA
jgi:uncharacterized membrane protein YccC